MLVNNTPPLVMSCFVISIVLMNILAGKELFTTGTLAFDCGFTISWLPCLFMDALCKRYGAKASFMLSLTAIGINFAICLIFFLLSLAPGHWGAYYATLESIPAAAPSVDEALNTTLGGSWYIVSGSLFALSVGSGVNAVINHLIARHLKRDDFRAFALRSYISTGIAQFVDNLLFAIVVSHVLFGWSWTQMLSCAGIAAAFELFCEIVASPLGYKAVRHWEKHSIGQEYIDFIQKKTN